MFLDGRNARIFFFFVLTGFLTIYIWQLFNPKEKVPDQHGLTLFRGASPGAKLFSMDSSLVLLDGKKPIFPHQDLLNLNAETVFSDIQEEESGESKNLLIPRASVEPGLATEASVLCRKAREFKENGRNDKARKLYERALLLHPERPDLLSEYGEFVEQTSRDIALADHLYTRALALDGTMTSVIEAHERLR